MKILFLADVPLKEPASGSEQVLNQQATGLAREGMDVYAITRQADPPAWDVRTVAGVKEGTYRASKEDIIRAFFAMVRYPPRFCRRFAQDTPFQAIVCHQPFNRFSLLIGKKLQNVPLIYVFHSPSHEEYLLSHGNRRWLRNLLQVETRRWIEGSCLKTATKVMVLSRYMKQKVQDIHGMPTDRIEVNPGGVDLGRFRPPQNREAVKRQLGFPEGKIHLLTVRNMEPRMGLDNLIKCVGILKKNQADVHLILGGEGIERQNLENSVQEFGLADTVTMTGFIPSGLLPYYYGAADFFVLPTRHMEGFGLVTPESMACGTPVLGTPVGGTKEILSGFDPDLLFKDLTPEAMAEGIRMAIEKLFADKGQYANIRLQCREYAAQNYSWQRHIDQLKSILDEVVAQDDKTSQKRVQRK